MMITTFEWLLEATYFSFFMSPKPIAMFHQPVCGCKWQNYKVLTYPKELVWF